MSIGERLKELRGGLSQKAAALQVGIKQQVWNRYEKDETSPASDSIVKICTTFGCSADWLLGLTQKSVSTIQAGDGSAVAIGGNASVVNGAPSTPGESAECRKCPYRKKLDKLEKLLSK